MVKTINYLTSLIHMNLLLKVNKHFSNYPKVSTNHPIKWDDLFELANIQGSIRDINYVH